MVWFTVRIEKTEQWQRMHRWHSGRAPAFQAGYVGSIPTRCSNFESQGSEVVKHDAHNVESQVRFLTLQPI